LKNTYIPPSPSISHGYYGGGYCNTASPYVTCLSFRLTFSTTTIAAATNLAYPVGHVAGLSDGNTAGYGYIAGGLCLTQRYAVTNVITFSTSAIGTNAPSNLSTCAYSRSGLSDGCVYGYWGGGNAGTNPGAYVKTTDQIVFSTRVTSAWSSCLTACRTYHAGISSGGALGYWGGGYNNCAYAGGDIIDKMTFATGVIAANTASNLSNYNGGGCTWAFFGGSGLSEYKA
jgi:hypothetical protein